mgnify:CR=1 FL=1
MVIDHKTLRRLAKAATPGPWHSPGLGELHASDHLEIISGARYPDEVGKMFTNLSGKDADYIAALDPQTILALLDELAAAEATAERRLALLEHWTQLQTLGSVYTSCVACSWEAAPGRSPHAPGCAIAAELNEDC